jgi:hypothetical protein
VFQELYVRLGLNKRQIELIAEATPKREYYVTSEKGRRLFELALGPLALIFCGASDKDTIVKIQGLEKKLGPEWDPSLPSVQRLAPSRLHRHNMTTVLTPEKEVGDSYRGSSPWISSSRCRNWLRLPSRLDNASSFCALNLEDGRPPVAIAREIKHDFRPLREPLESRRQHQSESRVYFIHLFSVSYRERQELK